MTTCSRFFAAGCRPLSRWAVLCPVFFYSFALLAQDSPYQRTFPISVADAKGVVQTLSATSRGRLPTLEGFVQENEQFIERYEKGYFECTFQISPSAAGTTIRASAKITAWYKDPDPTRSGYRILASNGRLESDALDRIAEVISPGTPSGSATPPAASPTGTARIPSSSAGGNPPLGTSSSAVVGPAPHVPVDKTFSLPPGTTLESMKATQAEDEKKSAQLSNYIKNLEEIQRNQSRPDDLAAVKTSKTPVFAKPAENAQVLMNADSQDEFPILSVEGSWVHVQISGVSRGWIHRAQLEMPPGLSQANASSVQSPSRATVLFHIAREETTPFSGKWPPLQGKPVRIAWVKPVNPAIATSQKEKLAFAKSIFLEFSANLPPTQQSPEGVVVVFDSADGGQIAAPLSSVKALANRTLSDAAFWRQCSLDPPESFLDSGKTAN